MSLPVRIDLEAKLRLALALRGVRALEREAVLELAPAQSLAHDGADGADGAGRREAEHVVGERADVPERTAPERVGRIAADQHGRRQDGPGRRPGHEERHAEDQEAHAVHVGAGVAAGEAHQGKDQGSARHRRQERELPRSRRADPAGEHGQHDDVGRDVHAADGEKEGGELRVARVVDQDERRCDGDPEDARDSRGAPAQLETFRAIAGTEL
jgi:hypothetical protein